MSKPEAGPAHEGEPTQCPDQSSEAKSPRKQSHNTERLKWEDHIIVDQRVSSNSFRVGAYIAGHVNEKTRTAWPSTSTIEGALRLPRNAIFKSIKELKDCGHITVAKRKTKGGGNYNEYRLTFGLIDRSARTTQDTHVHKSRSKVHGASRNCSTKADQAMVNDFLLQYPMSGKTEDIRSISSEIARAVAEGHSFDALLAAADRYRHHCVRHSIAHHQVISPEVFLADRRWLDGSLFRDVRHREVNEEAV